MTQLRQFASAKNVHLTLVIHPRKESSESRLSMNSIFGTAKATQEADNVIILQAIPAESEPKYNKKNVADEDGTLVKFLDVKKNRFEGKLGSIPLHFDDNTLVYSELDSPSSQQGDSNSNSSNTGWSQPRPQPQQQPTPQQQQQHSHEFAQVDTVVPASDNLDVVPVPEEDAFSILTK